MTSKMEKVAWVATNTRFSYYQPNVKDNEANNKRNDSVMRALAKAMGKEWIELFDDLVPIARELQVMPNSQEVCEKYLTENGFKKMAAEYKSTADLVTVDEFAESKPQGTFIVASRNPWLGTQFTAVLDGVYYDKRDTGKERIRYYWYKAN